MTRSTNGPTDDDKVRVDGHGVEAELLADWRVLFGVLHGRFETGDFATGLRFVNAIGAAAEEVDHHPDIDLSYPRVDVRLTSHDSGGVTQRDIRLARVITDLAAQVGAKARPDQTSVLELGLDTPDHEAVKPFWAALLGYTTTDHDEEVVDPGGRRPTIWFQKSELGETPVQRWHLDLRLPPEVVDTRIQAALDAGGTLVSDERAPTFWVLADAQGNQACITTWLGRTDA